MKNSTKAKYLAIVLLMALVTFISVNVVSLYADGAGEPDITIEGKGQAHVEYDLNKRKIHYWCDNSDSTPCRITVHRKTPSGE